MGCQPCPAWWRRCRARLRRRPSPSGRPPSRATATRRRGPRRREESKRSVEETLVRLPVRLRAAAARSGTRSRSSGTGEEQVKRHEEEEEVPGEEGLAPSLPLARKEALPSSSSSRAPRRLPGAPRERDETRRRRAAGPGGAARAADAPAGPPGPAPAPSPAPPGSSRGALAGGGVGRAGGLTRHGDLRGTWDRAFWMLLRNPPGFFAIAFPPPNPPTAALPRAKALSPLSPSSSSGWSGRAALSGVLHRGAFGAWGGGRSRQIAIAAHHLTAPGPGSPPRSLPPARLYADHGHQTHRGG